ncbi:UTRA domain-containing protein [Pikeienuella piscinae]|uniref:UTRA domain-containing protein n=1 Tax=Pikeienuella piscinae TaxID=2748098 RepID=A0A7L5BTG6_9RHOB|nr:UTRA domain-containing protein [Pikeienuella piscinae]QIE54702.1 UTRA domain-containing protein [Pikeienuella piscinae]
MTGATARRAPPRGDWRAVHDEALRRIGAREWPPGALIPAETELAEEFGCARATVGRALRELAASGLVERRRRAGTRVAEQPSRHARLTVPLIREEIETTGATYSYALIGAAERKAPPAVAARLEGAERLLHVAATHFADARPFVFEERWINLDVVPEAARSGLFAEISANEWLVRNAPFAGGEMALSAAPAEAAEAAALGLAKGAPLFIVERLTRSPDAVITLARLAYAPGRRMRLEL